MQLYLGKKPKSPIVLEGFPGFGLVGTIATEYLLNHLKCEQIGRCYFEQQAPSVAIHSGQVLDPVAIFYNKEFNLVIVHSIANPQGIEWAAAEMVLNVCKMLNAKELISIEGVGSPTGTGNKVYYYTSDHKREKKLTSCKIEPLGEGIIIGVTSAILLKTTIPTTTCLFAETHSQLPDSKASAEVIKVLDMYLGLKVDPKPLLRKAEEVEEKLKGIMKQSEEVKRQRENKDLRYVG